MLPRHDVLAPSLYHASSQLPANLLQIGQDDEHHLSGMDAFDIELLLKLRGMPAESKRTGLQHFRGEMWRMRWAAGAMRR